jgi:hypothetical protein
MTNFIAIKIHYDHRKSLAPHLKYSMLPTANEYNEYLELYRNDGVGGMGFHECLNYAISDNGLVQVYLPPTCLPAQKKLDDEFVIFSFTYKGDREMPARIVGVHAGAKILNREGIPRIGIEAVKGIDEPFLFHAESPENLVTLFIPSIEYDFREGVYTPRYKSWGYGLRNIEEKHAKNIIQSAFELAKENLEGANVSKREILEREIGVLKEIDRRYFSSSIFPDIDKSVAGGNAGWNPPDKEIGYLGERYVYEQELNYIRNLGIDSSQVEWVSQSSPQSPFDIKSVRKTENGIREYFIEVKSSCADDDQNIYVSSRQIEFFNRKDISGEFALVTFEKDKRFRCVRKISIQQLDREFNFLPIKFKLQKKSA